MRAEAFRTIFRACASGLWRGRGANVFQCGCQYVETAAGRWWTFKAACVDPEHVNLRDS